MIPWYRQVHAPPRVAVNHSNRYRTEPSNRHADAAGAHNHRRVQRAAPGRRTGARRTEGRAERQVSCRTISDVPSVASSTANDRSSSTWSKSPGSPAAPKVPLTRRLHSPSAITCRKCLARSCASPWVPVHLSVRNTLDQPVHLRGLSDRTPGDTVMNGASGFMQRDLLVLAPGETREVQFTPTTAVTSFYFAAVVRDLKQPPTGPDAGLTGAFIVDATGTTVDPADLTRPLRPPGSVDWHASENVWRFPCLRICPATWYGRTRV